jgi:protein-disulfide isomerase
MRASLPALALALALPLLAACSGVFNTTSQTDPQAEPLALPGPVNAPPLKAAASEPEELPGVDTSQLSRREKELAWRMVTELYAPCQREAVSLAVCVKEKRACASCVPAVKLLVDKIHEGASSEQAQTVYATRFGPKLKQVDLADSPSEGAADAPVTIVEWFDFECPHCKIAGPVLEKLVEKHPRGVRLVQKFFPLKQHPRADVAARAAWAAQQQGKYWDMERTLFAHQDALTDQDLEKYATDLKLDVKRWKSDMASSRAAEVVARDRDQADKLGLTGTPFILINGREFDLGLFHFESDLEPWVDLELQLAGRGAAGPGH